MEVQPPEGQARVELMYRGDAHEIPRGPAWFPQVQVLPQTVPQSTPVSPWFIRPSVHEANSTLNCMLELGVDRTVMEMPVVVCGRLLVSESVSAYVYE